MDNTAEGAGAAAERKSPAGLRARRRLWDCERHGCTMLAPVLALYIQGSRPIGGCVVDSKQAFSNHAFHQIVLACVGCLLFWATSGWAQEGPTAIYVMNADGSAARQLVKVDGYSTHSFPRRSHDGRWILFDAMPKAGQRELFLVNANGGELRKLGIGSTPSWSPDDKQVAFYLFGFDGRPQVVVQNLDGNGRNNLGPGKSPAGQTTAACWP